MPEQHGNCSPEWSDAGSPLRISPQTMIRPARELAGISLRELARRIGVSVGTMSAIETGKTVAGTERLDVIAAELGTTVHRLSEADPVPAGDPTGGHPLRSPFDWRVYPALELDPVLAAAIACFVRTGYHGATMRTVAAEAGISVPGVYHHYANKQALLVAGVDLALAELRAHLPPARDDAADPVARLGNLCEALTRFAIVRADLARIVVHEANAATEAQARAALLDGEVMSLLRTEIDAGAAEDTLDADHPHETARAIVSLCLGVSRRNDTDTDTVARRYARYSVRLAGGGERR
ncbi:TetR family transcriptional regulator [Gordonia sp. zg691]|uniref:TetR family transcriptional regulator n=1 Tax=Gordonia jinghuaiqii TaxID=2758710 RepID=UPI0016621FF4|nr:TetR family transcriptional regulator [Gordonia jinghuaiqii]MBD0860026.1 TetR family transcriptional regulator [Gordonia jinghuaiqii]